MTTLVAESHVSRSSVATRNDVISIQYLRGIAAVLVVFAHASEQIINNGRKSLILLHDVAWSGVDLFFVISGFVIFYAYARRQSAATRPRWSFVSARLARVLPLYWIMTAATAALALAAPHAFKTTVFSLPKLIFSLLFVPFLDGSGNIDPLLHLGWTLNYEMFFYFCFAIFLNLPPVRRLLCLLALFTTLIAANFILPMSSWVVGFYGNPLTLEFVAGCTIALAFRSKSWPPMAPLAAIALIVWGGVLVFIGAKLHGSLEGRVIWKGLPVATIVVGALCLERGAMLHYISQSVLGKILQAIGDSTYSIYLTHIFVVMLLRKIWLWRRFPMDGAPSLIFIFACMAGAISIGLLVYYCPYVGERMLVKRAKSFFTRLSFAR